MPTIVGILTFMSGKNSILGLSEPKKWISWYFYTNVHLKFHAQLSWALKKFYNLGVWFFGFSPVFQWCILTLQGRQMSQFIVSVDSSL